MDNRHKTLYLIPILRQFINTDDVLGSQPFGNGHIHITKLVSLPTQKLILQQINHQVFKDVLSVMRNIQLVADYLHAAPDYPLEILRPCLTATKKNYFKDENGNYWRMFPFIENTTTLAKIENTEQAYTIAQAFGTFIHALDRFPSEQLTATIPNFHNGLFRLQQLKQTIKRANPLRLKAAGEALNIIKQEAQVFEQIAQLKLPQRVVHNDTKADNILLDQHSFSARCVIDLDTLMPGTLLSDFGDMVRTCTNSEVEDSNDFEAIEMRLPIYNALQAGFLDALQDVMQKEEKNALLLGAKWIILEQATRFLTDFLAEDKYYKTKYPEHNLVRAHNQLALYQSLTKQLKF